MLPELGLCIELLTNSPATFDRSSLCLDGLRTGGSDLARKVWQILVISSIFLVTASLPRSRVLGAASYEGSVSPYSVIAVFLPISKHLFFSAMGIDIGVVSFLLVPPPPSYILYHILQPEGLK